MTRWGVKAPSRVRSAGTTWRNTILRLSSSCRAASTLNERSARLIRSEVTSGGRASAPSVANASTPWMAGDTSAATVHGPWRALRSLVKSFTPSSFLDAAPKPPGGSLTDQAMPSFDPGPTGAFAPPWNNRPNYTSVKARMNWGPIYYRGRLDGTARVIIGQDPATDKMSPGASQSALTA